MSDIDKRIAMLRATAEWIKVEFPGCGDDERAELVREAENILWAADRLSMQQTDVPLHDALFTAFKMGRESRQEELCPHGTTYKGCRKGCPPWRVTVDESSS